MYGKKMIEKIQGKKKKPKADLPQFWDTEQDIIKTSRGHHKTEI